jgi:glutamate decarboxylase
MKGKPRPYPMQLVEADVDLYRSHVQKHATRSGKATHNHPEYKNEKHSLQGKHGKTHAVC